MIRGMKTNLAEKAKKSATTPVTASPRELEIARWISMVLHPFIIAPLAIVFILYLDGVSLWASVGWAGLCVGLVIAPVVTFIGYRLARQQVTDADVSVREHRYAFYALAVACMAVCLGLLYWLDAPSQVRSVFASGLATLSAFAITTRLWLKVSIHAGMMSGMTAAVAFYSLPLAGLLALCTAAVAWSRLVLKRHTPLELAWGLVIAGSSAALGILATR